jgi:type II secretory pathway pseudopilin PulG
MARSLATCLRRGLRDERGFTLTEQLVVCGSLAVILGAILGLADLAAQTAPVERERIQASRDAGVAVNKMTRELRKAHAITIEPFRATAQVLIAGATVTVTYDCSAAPVNGLRRCDRSVNGGPAETVLPRVANATSRPVFTASERADSDGINWVTYVRTLVEVPSTGERTVGARSRIVLDDGLYLRNIDALH